MSTKHRERQRDGRDVKSIKGLIQKEQLKNVFKST
jgi:hypothetical protein